MLIGLDLELVVVGQLLILPHFLHRVDHYPVPALKVHSLGSAVRLCYHMVTSQLWLRKRALLPM